MTPNRPPLQPRDRRATWLRSGLLALVCALAGCASPAGAPSAYQLRDELPSGRAPANPAASARVNTELAAAYLESGRYDVALEVIARALAAEPDSALALGIQGLIYGELNDRTRAEQSFARALALAPHDPDLNHNYGSFLCRSGRVQLAAPYFEAALASPGYPRSASSHAAFGQCLLDSGRAADAGRQFDAALDQDSGNAMALLGLAELAYRQRGYTRGRELLARYGDAHAASAESLWLALKIERASGNQVEASGLEADLARLFPDSKQAHLLAARPKAGSAEK